MEAAERLTKSEALKRYEKLKDARVGFAPSIERARRLAAVALPEELKAFSRATGHLSWPESFGQTPWETASVVGFALRAEEEHPDKGYWAADVLGAYRSALGSRASEYPEGS